MIWRAVAVLWRAVVGQALRELRGRNTAAKPVGEWLLLEALSP